MGILVEEESVDVTQHCRSGPGEVYESRFETSGEAFRAFSKLYGRCQSSVYVDEGGKTKRIGWVFQKQAKYEDTGKPFILETWVMLHTARPTKTVTEHFLELEDR